MTKFAPYALRPAGLRATPRLRRAHTLLAAPLVVLLASAGVMFAPAAANADSSSTLTVVGTSDVSDSGLSQNLIQPLFNKEYPQFSYAYSGNASGVAVDDAEAGTPVANGQSASVLLVHAPSLENQFVANGYSYNNQYGYAIFRNDFVLAGPSADPAGVSAAGANNGAHNIAQAFVDVANAGANGTASFISRGNTSGTTVSEHGIWALVAANPTLLAELPASVSLCAISSANGGGDAPILSADVSGNGAECPAFNGNPAGSIPNTPELPSWYISTNDKQAANVEAANACTSGSSGPNSCYVYTDRGTYDYLISGFSPSADISLKILTSGPQSSTAPGGEYALTNYFHAYIINPSKSGEAVNLTAAQDLITLLTSPTFQSDLATYLNFTEYPNNPDSLGVPFVGDASPALTQTGLPATVAAGKSVTVTGAVTNEEPGYPAPSNATVSVDEIVAGVPVPVASTTTNSDGTYSVTFVPTSSGSYQVSTGQISQIENSSLSPVFGDILSPAATTAEPLTVTGLSNAHVVSFKKTSSRKKTLTVTGTITPGPFTTGATVKLLGLAAGSSREKVLGNAKLKAGATSFTIKAKAKPGSVWILQLEYVQSGQANGFSGVKAVHVK